MSARKRTAVRVADLSDRFDAPGLTLHRGDWRDVLPEQTCDAVIFDPPYGARTHAAEVNSRSDGHVQEGLHPEYDAWTAVDVSQFVTSWSPRTRGWMISLTSHDLIPAWESAYDAVGRYCFAPVPCVMRGMSVRLLNDGPSSWAVYAIVARPRAKEFMNTGVRPGAYTGPAGTEAGGGRGKPAWLMNALVRDYTKPGDLVCDPLAGWGATLSSALSLGRNAIGSEVNVDAYTEAIRRLRRPLQIDLLSQGEANA